MKVIKKWINKLGIDWKKWTILIALGIIVPFASLGVRITDSLAIPVDIADVNYAYLTTNYLLLWIVIYLLLTNHREEKKKWQTE